MNRMPEEMEDVVTGLISNLRLLESIGAGDIYIVKPAHEAAPAQAIETECASCPLRSARLGVAASAGGAASAIAFVASHATADALAGEPYSGEAGALLSRIITGEKAMGYATTDEVYLTYAVRCVPPDNVIPDEAVKCCAPLLERELNGIGARVVIALGSRAASAITGSSDVEKLRGRVHRKGALKVIVTYDMDSLVKNPALKKPAWDDIRSALNETRKP